MILARARLAAAGVFVAFAALYLLTANQLFSFDAVTNAIACQSVEAVRWFHGNHPFYPFLGVVWYRIEKLFGFQGLAIYSLARLNALLMAGALGIFARALAPRMGVGRACLIACVLGVSYAPWEFAVDGRAVGASMIFAAAVIALILFAPEISPIGPIRLMGLILFSALYVLTHGIAVFHIAGVGLWIFLREQKERAIRATLLYVVTTFVLIATVYLFIFFLLIAPTGEFHFFPWALGYVSFQSAGPAHASRFWSASVSEAAKGAFLGWRTAWIAAPNSGGMAAIGALAAMVWMGVGIALGLRCKEPSRYAVAGLTAWGFLIGVFVIFWSPGQEGFRLHSMFPWTAAAAIGYGARRAPAWSAAVFGAAVFLLNFDGAIYPASFIQNNTGYQLLTELEQHVRPGDIVLTAQAGIPGIEVLRPYFFPTMKGGTIQGRLFAFREKSLEPLYARLCGFHEKGNNIWLGEDVFDVATQRAIEKNAGLSEGEMSEFANRFKKEETFSLSSGYSFFRANPRGSPSSGLVRPNPVLHGSGS